MLPREQRIMTEPATAEWLAVIRSLRSSRDELETTLRKTILVAVSLGVRQQDVAAAAGLSISTLHRLRADLSDD